MRRGHKFSVSLGSAPHLKMLRRMPLSAEGRLILSRLRRQDDLMVGSAVQAAQKVFKAIVPS